MKIWPLWMDSRPPPPKWTPEQERRAREQKAALKELVKPLQAKPAQRPPPSEEEKADAKRAKRERQREARASSRKEVVTMKEEGDVEDSQVKAKSGGAVKEARTATTSQQTGPSASASSSSGAARPNPNPNPDPASEVEGNLVLPRQWRGTEAEDKGDGEGAGGPPGKGKYNCSRCPTYGLYKSEFLLQLETDDGKEMDPNWQAMLYGICVECAGMSLKVFQRAVRHSWVVYKHRLGEKADKVRDIKFKGEIAVTKYLHAGISSAQARKITMDRIMSFVDRLIAACDADDKFAKATKENTDQYYRDVEMQGQDPEHIGHVDGKVLPGYALDYLTEICDGPCTHHLITQPNAAAASLGGSRCSVALSVRSLSVNRPIAVTRGCLCHVQNMTLHALPQPSGWGVCGGVEWYPMVCQGSATATCAGCRLAASSV
jgi:hypothetical protein